MHAVSCRRTPPESHAAHGCDARTVSRCSLPICQLCGELSPGSVALAQPFPHLFLVELALLSARLTSWRAAHWHAFGAFRTLLFQGQPCLSIAPKRQQQP